VIDGLRRLLRQLLADNRQPAMVELRFGSDLTQQTVEALLAVVAGLPRRSAVLLETLASEQGIRHLLRADQATLDTVCGQLRGLAPSTRIEPTPPPTNPDWQLGVRLGWSGRHALLRTDGAADAAAGLLSAFRPLSPGEALLVQVALRPGHPLPLPPTESESGSQALSGAATVAAQVVSGLRSKQSGPLMRCRVLVAVTCGHPKRGAHLLGRVVSVFRSRRGAYAGLQVRRLSRRGIQDALRQGAHGGDLLSPRELVGLVGWPIGAPPVPGLELGTSPLLASDRRIPTAGRLLGISTWPAAHSRTLAQPVTGGLSHTLICGPTGSGKSSLLCNLIAADVRAGRGCLVVDGKGDLIEDVLTTIPPERVQDVIVIDPARGGAVPGLRLFTPGTDPDLAADVVLGVLKDIFRESWGVRSEQWLRAGLVTLAHDPAATLGDLPYLFSDDAYRQRLIGRIDDPLLHATWAAFEAMRPAERSNQLGAPLNKLTQLLGRRLIRAVLSQPDGIDLRDAIRRNRIVLVSLSPGRLGTPAARLTGALFLHGLFSAVQSRAALRLSARRPFFVYVDEPAALGDIPVPLDSLFETARGMGVGLTLAAQSVSQLPRNVARAALTNSATLLAFRQTADDAELLARQLPGITAEGLQHLGAFEAFARVGLGPGETTSPCSLRTLTPPPLISNPTAVRHASAQRYGKDPKAVDEALAARHYQHRQPRDDQPEGEVGRRRRHR
jgi:hypothetical protein